MATAIDVADFFIDLANHTVDEIMTNLRVNKLLYYAQAYSLVRFGKPLFPDNIQAWKYGPVVPPIYQKFRVAGGSPIHEVSEDYSPDKFTRDEISLLLDVAREYGQYSSPKLIRLTHVPGGPWEQVYHHGERGTVIPTESIREYFSHNPLPKFELHFTEDNFVGYRNADGYLVLPKEYDDDTE